MLVSFVITWQEIEQNVNATLQSVLNQTDDDYEIILISDKMIQENEEFDILRNYFWDIKKIKTVVNSSIQGAAVCWNTAIDLADGDYIKFISQGDTISPDFVKNIRAELKKYDGEEIDLIEYNVQLHGLSDDIIDTYLEKGKVYNLNREYSPYAHVSATLANKLFRTKLLKEFGFKFRRFVRFDMLFTYKVLGQTDSYVFLNTKEPLETMHLGQVQYSVFDLVNQWTHILNYYRRIGKFRDLKDYLNYAYYKTLVHIWLWNIRKYDNKLLIKKAATFANRKFEDKREDFMKNNKAFKETKDVRFIEIVDNFATYIKEILKLAR
ncbi:glycosyltransferase family 2 protein [Spiroplasma sp. BIUS-1]|uniref:glycosyltransferase family 2 protein n=1 Tax=Spiroplasma sp. BIUS-1 TaxID=216964 RepID=UPI001397DC52|nr:glycosyltransferase family 2 protein [Spiroplasma sp. BIUS-1]QHX36343.1 glycosyltransferase [Spiroplasma sp. BIUS-1]